MKRVLLLVMAAALVMGMTLVNCQPLFAGQPSEKEVVQIQSAQDLLMFAERVNNGDTALDAELASDIDLSGICSETAGSWTPIKDYEGTFEGNGHVISGLYCVNSDSSAALFGSASVDSEIRNVILEDVYVIGNKYAAGVVASGSGDVSGCRVSGYVKGKEYAAGICGSSGSVYDCENYAEIVCDNEEDSFTNGRCGGVAGEITREALNCINYGTVTGAEWVTAGVIGGTPKYGGYDTRYIENCFNYGTVEGYLDTGGVVGYIYRTLIQHCGNDGDITGMAYVGGVVCATNKENDGSLIINCYNKGTVTGKDWGEGNSAIKTDRFDFIDEQRVGGIASEINNCHICNCYSQGSVQSLADLFRSTVAGIVPMSEYKGFISNSYANVSFICVNGYEPIGIGLKDDKECDNCFFVNGGQRPSWSIDPVPGQPESWFYDNTVTSLLNGWPTQETDPAYPEFLNRFDAEADKWFQGENGPVFLWEIS